VSKTDPKQKRLIDIPNWDKYQRPLKGKGGASSRRSWVAMSVDLFSDPDFLELKQCEQLCWIGIVLHAGKVGVPFELSPSSARVLFKLKHTPDFDLLENQGFIKSRNPTNKTNKTNKRIGKKDAAKAASSPSRFDDFWKVYPVKRAKQNSQKAWLKDQAKFDAMADKLIADVQNRIEKDGQWLAGFVPYPLTYLNQERWTDDVIPPREENKPARRIPNNDAGLLAMAQDLGVPTRGKDRFELKRAIQAALN